MGFVYLICDNESDTYKIGMTTKSPEKRLKELKTGNSNEIFLIEQYESKYYKVIERTFHKRYSHLCENREWFKLPNDVVFGFQEMCKKIEDTHIFLLENNDLYKKKHS